jgi:inner membrane protein
MQWWAWIAVGAILLGAELTFVDAQFYLVFIGASAFVVGMLELAGLAMPDWLQWLVFALLAAGSVFTFRRRIYELLRRKLPPLEGGPQGEVIVLPTELQPGASCRLEYRGGSWSAMNGGPSNIPAGAKARIERVEGLTLVVVGDAT